MKSLDQMIWNLLNLGNSYSTLRTIKWWAERRAQETQNWAQMLHHVKNLGGREREMGVTQRYLKKKSGYKMECTRSPISMK